MENIDILSCNLTGIKPRYDRALNEISGIFFSISIPQVNAWFVLLLQAYSVCYILFCLFFPIDFLFSIWIYICLLSSLCLTFWFLSIKTHDIWEHTKESLWLDGIWASGYDSCRAEWNDYAAERCRGRPFGRFGNPPLGQGFLLFWYFCSGKPNTADQYFRELIWCAWS